MPWEAPVTMTVLFAHVTYPRRLDCPFYVPIWRGGPIDRLDGNIWNVFCTYAKVRIWPI